MKSKTHFFQDLNLSTILEPADPSDKNYCATKVVGTIGPACQAVDNQVAMLEAGMSAARFDLTWGPIEYHRRSLDNLQTAMRQTRKLCAIVLDTLGREVMIRRPFRIEADGWPNQAGQEITVKMGRTLTLTTRDVECTDTLLPVTYSKFAGMMEVGDTLYVGRYLVSGADSASLYLENDLPLLSEYDKECIISLAADYEIDFISLSYTRSVDDVIEARSFLDAVGLANTKIFAKLESRQSLLNFKGILNEADGIIISRSALHPHFLQCVVHVVAAPGAAPGTRTRAV
eukprot:gene3154-3431_t